MTTEPNNDPSIYYTPKSLTNALQKRAGSEKMEQPTAPNHDLILSNPPFGSRAGCSGKASPST